MTRSIKTFTILAVISMAISAPAGAQNDRSSAANKKQSFQEFRKGLLSDYHDFRQNLLDGYADFLAGEWHPYQSYNGEKRDSRPKPRTVPRVKEPNNAQPKEDTKQAQPEPQPQPAVTPREQPAVKPAVKPARNGSEESFEFYGLPLQVPRIDFSITDRLYSNADYAAQWRALQQEQVAEQLLPVLKSVADQAGLNDYLTYQLINSYIDAKFPSSDATSRMAAVHYLLANLGYDARIATTDDGTPLLLIPFNQTIYSRTYLMIGNRKYYVFEPEGFSLAKAGPKPIRTCRLPDGVEGGRTMDLVLGELRLPEKPKTFDLEYGPIHLTGEVNENIMPILYHYPQMPVSDFAKSNIQPELRCKLVSQMKSQLQNMSGDEAVGKLLEFMHNVFSYSTDEDFHGFEKPYFLEEMLYYPKNDCEDRAIFYTYFLWNALGKPAQLISFPGHEAATVSLDTPVEGTAYDYDNRTFYISDPTYIGSKTGMIMPPYRDTPPNIDYTFK